MRVLDVANADMLSIYENGTKAYMWECVFQDNSEDDKKRGRSTDSDVSQVRN